MFQTTNLKCHGVAGLGAIPYMSNCNVTINIPDIEVIWIKLDALLYKIEKLKFQFYLSWKMSDQSLMQLAGQNILLDVTYMLLLMKHSSIEVN